VLIVEVRWHVGRLHRADEERRGALSEEQREGNQVAVVVSAMSGETKP
jgi:hypothetical protein